MKWACTLLLLACAALAQTVHADVIRLKSGGEVRGVITAANETQVSIETMAGSKIEIPANQIHFHVRRSAVEEEYETRLAQLPDTAEAHWNLANWCKANKLREQRKWQLTEVLLRAPNHALARRALKYTQVGVQWSTRDQAMRKQGYVKVRKRYVTRQERDSIARTADERQAEADWSRQLARLANRIQGGEPGALSEMQAVSDPIAIAGLTAFFREASDPVTRQAYVQALGRIKHEAALAPLVEQSVFDTSPAVRATASASISNAQSEDATKILIGYLEVDDYYVIENAATTIGQVGHPDAVEPLIEALVTLHQYSTRPSAAEEVRQRAADLLNREDLTPEEVRIVMQSGLMPLRGVSATTEESNGRVQLLYPHRNESVLAALRSLTGEDFGYNQRTWRLWLRSNRDR